MKQVIAVSSARITCMALPCEGVVMKQFLVSITLAVLVAVGSQAEARLVSTKAACTAACGQGALSDACGGITKRGKFNHCRAKLINKCKRVGQDAICPPVTPVVSCYQSPDDANDCIGLDAN